MNNNNNNNNNKMVAGCFKMDNLASSVGGSNERSLLKRRGDHQSRYYKMFSLQNQRLDASTSMSEVTPELEESGSNRDKSTKGAEEAEESITVDQLDDNLKLIDEKGGVTSSYEGSENDAVSVFESQSQSPRKISSQIALFLENLNVNRKKSRSLASLTSYNLDSLFADPCCGTKPPSTTGGDEFDRITSVFSSSENELRLIASMDLFSESNAIPGNSNSYSYIYSSSNNKRYSSTMRTGKKYGRKGKNAGRKQRELLCKKQQEVMQKRCQSTCGGAANDDPCTPLKNEQHGKPCKVYQEPFPDDDPCEQFYNEDIHGPLCKKKKKRDKREKKCKAPRREEKCERRRDECKREKKCDNGKKKEEDKCKCPPVFRAPGCPPKDSGDKGSYRKYSTLISKISVYDDFKGILSVDLLKDIVAKSEHNYQEKMNKIGLFNSSVFNVPSSCYAENLRT